jgi:cellulose synthase/poly-beta-1,6-N-acetylglucosamine synthase-like glycosyltransferase
VTEIFVVVVFLSATLTAVAFLKNLRQFQTAPPADTDAVLPSVSVLIPARDEADRIRQTLDAVLANTGVDLEVIVLDDQSQDGTAAIVAEIAAADARVRVVSGGALPAGWCGKQFACYQLAQHARHDDWLFLDADVLLTTDAVRRCLLERQRTQADLLSGFPRQVVGSLGEALLLPLIHVVLLTYLPFGRMRSTKSPAASAGCGQMFLTSRQAYWRAGGHAIIRGSLHDGVTLPRAYRTADLTTDLFDASDVARCRMYRGWTQTWRGLSKNAHEGVANSRLILPATLLLGMGYVAPTLTAAYVCMGTSSLWVRVVAVIAMAISFLPRMLTAHRIEGYRFAALLLPLSVVLFLSLQWIVWTKNLFGARATWRGRAYSPTTV